MSAGRARDEEERAVLTVHRMGRMLGEELTARGISQADFCRWVGTTTKHLNEVIRGRCAAHPSTLNYWAWTLGLEWGLELRSRSDRESNNGVRNPQSVHLEEQREL
jgi:hypothetical protein